MPTVKRASRTNILGTGPMSALGQKRTSRPEISMSALPPKADIVHGGGNVRFVPEADITPIRPNVRSICSQIGSGSLLGLFPNKNSDAFAAIDWAFVGRRSYSQGVSL
jgi:hypothetical protein